MGDGAHSGTPLPKAVGNKSHSWGEEKGFGDVGGPERASRAKWNLALRLEGGRRLDSASGIGGCFRLREELRRGLCLRE